MSGSLPEVTAELRARDGDLRSALGALDGLVIAFSGGVDSTYLLKVAHDVLGDRAIALTAISPSFPDEEREAARLLARRIGARQLEVGADELAREGYVENSPDRCYFCKTELFEICTAEARRLGFDAIAFGAITDDLGDHRPGQRAADEMGIIAPLADAGLSKVDIRALSREQGLETWDKPSFACLASRIPYGTHVTVDRLRRIDAAESALRALGFKVLRVRDHHPMARIEVGVDELPRLLDPTIRAQADAACREAGFDHATVDPRGYRTGSLNEGLDLT